MRKTILGLVAAFAVIAAGSAPALACDSCSPCGYASPCGGYVQPYAPYERLPDPVVQYHSTPIAQPQYYYVEQGPTYTGPGNWAPRPTYEETALPTYRHHPYYWHHGYRHSYPSVRYGHFPHHTMRYGMIHHRYGWGHREHVLRRYY